MRHLVIGAPNFVAMRLVQRLAERREDVRVILHPGRNAQSQPARRLAELSDQVRAIPLSDNAGLVAAAEGVDVIHYADWSYQDWGTEPVGDGPASQGLRNVLAAATRARISRLVYVSTTDLYGFPGETVREPLVPSPPGLPYVDARAEAELAVWEHGRRVGLPLTVVRPTTVYGPGAPEFLVDAIRQLRDRRLYLVDRGTHIAGLTYVGNLVEAMILAGQAPEAAGQAYNINDDSSVTWAQYYGMLASMAELPPPTVSYSRTRALMMASLWAKLGAARGRSERPPLTRLMIEMMSVDQRYPIDKARRDFGYRPTYTFQEGLRETVGWLRESGVLADG